MEQDTAILPQLIQKGYWKQFWIIFGEPGEVRGADWVMGIVLWNALMARLKQI